MSVSIKKLKFRPALCTQILKGEKTTTWRIHDDKNLSVGDQIEFVNWETGVVFGSGTITGLKVKTLGTLEETDWIGHEKFASEAEMYETYKTYYGDSVGPESELKIINFTFQPTQ